MSVVERIGRGLGIRADSWMDGPAPGPGIPGYMSSPGRSQNYLGNIQLVPTLGHQRWATYRLLYLTNPWVYAAVQMISDAIARTPLHVFALDTGGSKSRLRGDLPGTPGRPSGGQALDKLVSNPTTYSRSAFMKGTMIDRLTNGNAIWRINRDSYGSTLPTSLTRIRWASIARVDYNFHDPYQTVNFYELVRRPGILAPERISPQDIVHFGIGSDPDSPMGVSPLESCSATMALWDAIKRQLLGHFTNAMTPSGHLAVEKLTKENAPEIRQMITEMYTSPENAGKVLITGQGKWESMGMTMADSSVTDLISASREEIAAAFAIPPPILGILDRAIKANVYELRTQYLRDGVGSWTAQIESELQAQLLTQTPSWQSLFVEFNLADQLRPDIEARALVYQRLMMVFTIDEIRGFENLSPLGIKGVSDVTWVPSGAQPLSAFLGGGAVRPVKGGTTAPAPEPDQLAMWEAISLRLAELETHAPNGNGHTAVLTS